MDSKWLEIIRNGGKVFLSPSDYAKWRDIAVKNGIWSEIERYLFCDQLGVIQDGKPIAGNPSFSKEISRTPFSI